MQGKLPTQRKIGFGYLIGFFAFLLISTQASARIFEIGFRKELNGTITLFFQSNFFRENCPNAFMTINVNGTNYTIENGAIQPGDYRNNGNTLVLAQANDCMGNDLSDPGSYCSWGSINLPCVNSLVVSVVDAGACYTSCLMQTSYTLTCDIPPPPRGAQGCTPGYWKNAKWWKGTVGVGGSGYLRGSSFFTTFLNPSNKRNLNPSLTLDKALNLGESGYNRVARHGTAALLNAANSNVDYPYTEAEIKQAVYNVFQFGYAQLPDPSKNYDPTKPKLYDVQTLGTELDRANNLGCPINMQGNLENGRSIAGNKEAESVSEAKEFAVSGYPNPSRTNFSIEIESDANKKVNIRVINVVGKLVQRLNGVAANQVIRLGSNYQPGVYYVEIEQGGVTKQLKLIKSN